MEYLFTERAHLMCPDMCFGIALTAKAEYDEKRIRDCVDKLSEAHPFLCAVLGYEEDTDRYFYDIKDTSQTDLFMKDDIKGTVTDAVSEEYRILTRRDWDLFAEGMLKISAWRTGEYTCFLMVFHHLLADGRGALGLAQELVDCYVSGKIPAFAQERLIASKDDMPEDSHLPFVSRMLVRKANRDWIKENRRISYEEYHRFADEFVKNESIGLSVEYTRREELDNMLAACRDNKVSLNDLLMAKMFIADDTEKIIIACDLRDRLDFCNKGAMGNYSTAFSIEMKKHGCDEYVLAKAVHEKVRKTMSSPSALYLVLQCYAELEGSLLDAAFISCRGGSESKAARFIGSMFFGFSEPRGYSITNLGRIESDTIDTAFFIPPASPAIKKTQGVLTVNGCMTVCTSSR